MCPVKGSMFKKIIFSLILVAVACFSTVGAAYVIAKYPLKDILSILLTPLIAIIATWIAYQQYVTYRAKVNLDLYERRMDVYKGIMNVLRHVTSEGKSEIADMANFAIATDECSFLFDEEFTSFVNSIYHKICDLKYFDAKAKEGDVDSIHKEVETLQWIFEQQHHVLKEKIKPFMNFRQYKSTGKLKDAFIELFGCKREI